MNVQKLALASSLVMGGAYILCAVAAALAPQLALQLFGWLTHFVAVGGANDTIEVTFSGALLGLAQAMVYTYAFVFAVGLVYGRLSKAQ